MKSGSCPERGVLKRFGACLEEVKTFLESKGLTFPEQEKPEWMEKLHFMVDMNTITSHVIPLSQSHHLTRMQSVRAFQLLSHYSSAG